MAMTGVVKDELSRVPAVKPCCRKTEVSTLLRFAGGLTLSSGHIVIEAELDTAAVARRLRASIAEVFGHTSELLVLAPGGLRRGNRYIVRVTRGGDSLARQAGLIDSFSVECKLGPEGQTVIALVVGERKRVQSVPPRRRGLPFRA